MFFLMQPVRPELVQREHAVQVKVEGMASLLAEVLQRGT